jgi:hypothetical protein
MRFKPTPLYQAQKEALTRGARLQLWLVEREIARNPDPEGFPERRVLEDGSIADESAEGLIVVYTRTGPRTGTYDMVLDTTAVKPPPEAPPR